jgi:hypothetical protein
LSKFEKTQTLTIKYLANGREYLTSENTGEFGVENWIGLYFSKFLRSIAKWEKRVPGFLCA